MTPIIRPAAPADRKAICALHLASWQANYGAELSAAELHGDLPAEMAAKWQDRRFGWPNLILVADPPNAAGAIAGFVCALADRDPPLIDNLHVRQELQSLGIGAALLDASFALLAAKGFRHATLSALESNRRARAFYARMGGRDEGVFEGELMGKTIREHRFCFDLTVRVGADGPWHRAE